MERISIGSLAAWKHPAENGKPHARALLIHGMGEHSGRHLNTVQHLVSEGLEVYRFDLRGCGHSGGPRQWIEHFDDYVADAGQIHNLIRTTASPLPLLVLGHSLGGAIALHFSARYASEISGLALSAPAFRVGSAVSPMKIAVGKVLSRFVPELKMPKTADAEAVSRDPEVVEAFKKDPLCCRFNTLRQGSEILRALDEIPALIPSLTMPLAVFHGTSDRIIQLAGSFEMVRLANAAKSRVLHVLPGGYHEPHNDLNKNDYFLLLSQWISGVLAEPTSQKPRKPLAGATRSSAPTTKAKDSSPE